MKIKMRLDLKFNPDDIVQRYQIIPEKARSKHPLCLDEQMKHFSFSKEAHFFSKVYGILS